MHGASPDLRVGRADVQQPFFHDTVHPKYLADVLGELAKAFLAVAQGDFGLHAGGDQSFQGPIGSYQLGGALPHPAFQLVAGALRLFLGLLLRGDVAGDADHADDAIVGVPIGHWVDCKIRRSPPMSKVSSRFSR